MFDLTLIKDMTELIGKSLSFKDIESTGEYFFKNFSVHEVENIHDSITVSPLQASKTLVKLCEEKNKLKELFTFIIELDGTLLNGKMVNLDKLENFLFRLSRTGIYFDFTKRKFVKLDEDKETLLNWGSLKDNKEYDLIIASVDICLNSELVKKYKTVIMEREYYKLWKF